MFFLTVAGFAQARTITIGPIAGCDFNTIQAGIDAANEGDTVLVAPGEYDITEPITFQGKAITVRSEVGRDETTIRMGMPADNKRGSVVIFENNETTASVLEGFTITGGNGGIRFDASSGTVSNCSIAYIRASRGLGVKSSLTLVVVSPRASAVISGTGGWSVRLEGELALPASARMISI